MTQIQDDRVAVPGTPGRRSRRWPLALLAVATLATVAYLLSAYVPPNPATSRIPTRGFDVHYGLLIAHIGTAAIAAVAGLAQFWPWLRRTHPVVHRRVGRAYFFAGVFPSALLAVPVALLAPLGASNQVALLTLDVLWFGTALAGYRAVRRRRFADHRRWMIRNYALTISSLVTRLATPVMVLAVVPQTSLYGSDQLAMSVDIASGSAWLGLMATMVVAEGYLQRRYGVPRHSTATGTP
jgi:uncharacterized membrane protein YozB (DUF420 family)